jgi:hypothetical protein
LASVWAIVFITVLIFWTLEHTAVSTTTDAVAATTTDAVAASTTAATTAATTGATTNTTGNTASIDASGLHSTSENRPKHQKNE